MKQRVFEVKYGPNKLRYSFLYLSTVFHFRNYIHLAEGEDYDIRIGPELMEIGRKQLEPGSTDSYVEYRIMISETARELLRFGACIFHSVAFVYRGRAWLLTAPSGVGKTTQFLNWQRQHPGEIEMICGDMPVLAPEEDERIHVYSTSWCGKENMGNKELTAPLAGIVLLEQGGENRISPLPPSDCVMPFFRQFVVLPETEEQCLALTGLMSKVLESVPVWKLVNLGDAASTEMLRDAFNTMMDGPIGGANDPL